MYAIVDIETTGGNAYTDKITEIAIFVHNGEGIVDQFVTLINPKRSIPPYVQNLTGITDEMVSNAPVFSDVAEQIKQLIEPYIFVAHSSQFDYSFIRQEFKEAGYDFRRPTLCTVTFSKRVMPGHRSYGLSALCERLSISNEMRHRAAGDAMATVRIFEQLLKQGGHEKIPELIQEHREEQKLPDCIRPEIMGSLPARPGIFYLINKEDEIIYIGKGNSIRKNIIELITRNKNKKSMKLREVLHDIRFEKTGSELMAAITEYLEWKKHMPAFNRKQWKPFQARLRSGFTNGYAVFKGRDHDEETLIRLENGNATGYAILDRYCQDDPASCLTPLPAEGYINYCVHRAIIKRHFVRLVKA